MAAPFLGQIMLCPYTYAPAGWADCSGQLLPISQNTALFSLLGMAFGGDGRSTFGLPNLQGRAAVGFGKAPSGSSYVMGEMTGSETVTLDANTLGNHAHGLNAFAGTASTDQAVGNSLAAMPTGRGGVGGHLYAPPPGNTTLAAAVVLPAGALSPLPHSNLQPFLALRYIIALKGDFPRRN